MLNRLHGNTQKVTKPGAESAVWNVIMPAGTFHRSDFGPKGVLTFDRAFFEKVIANWKKLGSPGLPIDRFHWGSSDNTEVSASDKAAVGFIEGLRVNANGDLEGLTHWNAEGKADIEADRFRYFSPEFHWDWVDQQSGDAQGPTLFGGGLLNDPYFKTLPRLAANDVHPKESTVNKKLLCAKLGLPETATDEQINAVLEKFEPVKAAQVDETLKASLETLKGEVAKQTAAAAEARKELDSIKASTAAKELAALQDRLLKEGRIIADDKERVGKLVAALGLDEATKLCAAWPVKVDLGERGVSGSDAGESIDDAVKKFEALVVEEIKKGASSREAMRRVTAAHRELAVKATTVTKPAEA